MILKIIITIMIAYAGIGIAQAQLACTALTAAGTLTGTECVAVAQSGNSRKTSPGDIIDFVSSSGNLETILFKSAHNHTAACSTTTEGSLWYNSTTNAFNFCNGSSDTAFGGISNVVEDTTPQLGGDLDLNSKNLDFPTTANISDVLDEDNMSTNSATVLATQQSIKAYADTKLANIVEDTTPQLSATLDGQDFDINDLGYIRFDSAQNQAVCTTAKEGEIFYNSATNVFNFCDGSNDLPIVATASTTTAGIAELATTAETDTGTDTGRTITPDGLAGSYAGTKVIPLSTGLITTNAAVGDSRALFIIPPSMNGMNLVGVHGVTGAAGTTGTMDIQIRNVTDTADMLSTVLQWDSGATVDDGNTVIDATKDDIVTNDVIAVDIDVIHTTPAKRPRITLEFRLP